jgi:uncharacterized protein YndB with AHSA1/START domain
LIVDKSNITTFSTPSDQEIVMTRIFDAPRELVFKAYTDPQAIEQWWGPRIYVTIVDQMDVRPGGKWRFINRNSDGAEFAFHGEYQEVVPPERLVCTFEFEGMSGHVVISTLIFEDLGGKTKVTSTSLFPTVDDRDGMLDSGMESGARDSWERLAEYLETQK